METNAAIPTNKSKKTRKNPIKKQTVVIIGDWFVDENWLMAKQESYSSSHTGINHYLSKHKFGKRMTSLCGAFELLVVLKKYFDKVKKNYEFIGFGAWNTNDNEILHCTFCEDMNKHFSPYSLNNLISIKGRTQNACPSNSSKCPKHRALKFINLAKNSELSTNRIIRCYEGFSGAKPNLLYRFDWQLPIKKGDLDGEKLVKELIDKDVKAVVIEDHGKGVIRREIIECLISALYNNDQNKSNGIKWYIRSKIDDPEWMDILTTNEIWPRLNVIDYKLAENWHGRRRWRVGKELTRASLELLGDLTGDEVYIHGEPLIGRKKYRSERSAIIFDKNTAIAKNGDCCYNLYDNPLPRQQINVGRTTMFFTALIAQDLFDMVKPANSSSASPEGSFGFHCHNALQIAFDWSKQASGSWDDEKLHFYGDYQTALRYLQNKNNRQYLDKYKDDIDSRYSRLWRMWNDSSKDIGVLSNNGEKKFQLWRGQGTLKEYICVGGPKRNAINDLLSKVYKFNKEKESKYPFNCLLVSSPGWGKSFLARSMANHFDMNYQEFSLSQMASTEDLINCFAKILSAQNESSKKVLIFMDEINCEVEGHAAMGLLLSPIWEGSFIQGGRKYRLSPAVWVFAATDTMEELMKANKGSDFVSRLNGPIINLDELATEDSLKPPEKNPNQQYSEDAEEKETHASIKLKNSVLNLIKEIKNTLIKEPDINIYEEDEYKVFSQKSGVFRTDQVYLGVSLLNKMWGPICKVQEDVLRLFHDLCLINGFRSLEFFVSKFHGIQGGIVRYSNVPVINDNLKELKRHVILPKYWIDGNLPLNNIEKLKDARDEQLIDIIIEP